MTSLKKMSSTRMKSPKKSHRPSPSTGGAGEGNEEYRIAMVATTWLWVTHSPAQRWIWQIEHGPIEHHALRSASERSAPSISAKDYRQRSCRPAEARRHPLDTSPISPYACISSRTLI